MLKEFDEEFESRFESKFTPKRQAILKELSKVDQARISQIAKALEVEVNFLGESFHFLVESIVLQRVKKGCYDFFDPVCQEPPVTDGWHERQNALQAILCI